MVQKENVIVVDIDGTLTTALEDGQSYANVGVVETVKSRLMEFKRRGFWIILATSRNMRTYEGNIGLIMKHTAPVLLDWLAQNQIPYDEIHFGKPKGGKAAQPAKAQAKSAKVRKPVAVKYRNPATNETWTGRGQPSTWIKAMEAAGRKREEFLVG